MRAYRISAAVEDEVNGKSDVIVFAGTMAEARDARQTIVNDHGVKKSLVSLEEIDIPTAKPALLAFLNELVA